MFCNSYNDCSRIYERMFNYLGNDKTVFRDYPNLLEYRLFTMYTRASEDEMKEKIMLLFNTKDTNLRVIIATAAFSMGVDIAGFTKLCGGICSRNRASWKGWGRFFCCVSE